MERRDIERINALTRLSRERELTPQEQAERAELRKNYLKAMRSQLVSQLDSVVVEYPDKRREPLRKKRGNRP